MDLDVADRGPVADLGGAWRAHVVDDELRRTGLETTFDDGEWPTLEVPGHWQSHPAFADSDGPVLMRRSFSASVPEPGRRRWVVLDGVFYQADVWLDGAYLGDPEGYFFPHRYDITSLARLGDEHLLAVEVSCSPESSTSGRRNVTGSLQHSEVVPQSWNPGGLWAPVTVVDTGPVSIERFRVLCRDADTRRAHLRLAATLDADHARRAVVRTTVDGTLLASSQHDLATGSNELEWSLDVAAPELWWPRALGSTALSDVTIDVLVDGESSDRRTRRTGFRQVSLSDWKCSINGERIFLKGVNVAPTRPGLADVPAGLERADLARVVEAGIDCVRVQAHVATPEFYDAADELGVLVLQDFPLTWSYGRHVRRAATRQAGAMVDVLGHHPSIVQWCAHDEPVAHSPQLTPGPRPSRWKRLARQQLPSWNRTILDRWVKRALEAADPTRPTVAHSGVLPHLPQLAGTSTHAWFGWHQGGVADLARLARSVPRLVRFLGEFGAQSVPLSAAGFVDLDAWPDLDWEQLRAEHGLDVDTMLTRHPPADHRDFEAWARATQRYQADLLRTQIELLRTLKYRPAGGFTFSLLADAAPMISAAVLDVDRVPKSAWAAVTEACRPVIVTCTVVAPGDEVRLALHVVNDLRRAVAATVTVTATAGPDEPGQRFAFRGDVGADDVAHVGDVRVVAPASLAELMVTVSLVGVTAGGGGDLDATPAASSAPRRVEYSRHFSVHVESHP